MRNLEPALESKPSTDENELSPPSTPAVVTDEQCERVRGALTTYARGKRPHEVAAALDYAPRYLRSVRRGEIRPSVHFAAALARVLGTELDALLGSGGP